MRLSLHDGRGSVVGLFTMILEPAFPFGMDGRSPFPLWVADSIPVHHFSGPILAEGLTADQMKEAHRKLATFVNYELRRDGALHLAMRIWQPTFVCDCAMHACLNEWEYVGFGARKWQTLVYFMPGDESSILRNYDHDFRNQVRQGLKRGGTVEVNRQVDANEVYELYMKTRKDQGIRPNYSLPEVASLLNAPGNINRDVYVCRYQGKAVAFAVCLVFNRTAVYWLAGTDRVFKEARPNNLIMDEFIRNSLSRAISMIDLGSGIKRGLREFKLSVGAVPTPYFELTKTYSHLFDLRKGYAYFRSLVHNIALN